ncbi:uncharacterized protein LOC119658095 [Hermetia illucens]|uniref:uncharacterized protein LOC119658095 n=1 Tax=Hermetia illucens TaxID=343691 RepID=UPI0018CC5858|nr:uncharacterized protein LOC119658095 [Hermetia illucens]
MTWHSPPFVIKITKDDGSVYLDGVEGSILNHLAKHMNFTVVLIPPPVEGFSGARLFTNGTATGIFGVIKRGEVDITIGSLLYSSRRAQVLGVTMPHYQQPLTIEVFIVGLKNTSPLYNMWVAAIGGQVNPLPGRNFARFMLMLWLLITAVLRGTYQGALYNFIRTNVEKELPNTLEELWKEKYSIWVDSLLAEWALPTTDLEKFNKIPVKVDFSTLYEFQNTQENIGFLIARDMVIHFNNLNYWEGRLYIVNERLLMQQYSMLFRKYSYLIVEVNGLVIRYSSSGLIMKWSKNFNTEKFAVDKLIVIVIRIIDFECPEYTYLIVPAVLDW